MNESTCVIKVLRVLKAGLLSYKLQCNVFKLRLLVWFFAGTGKTLLEQEKNAKDIDFIVLRSISRRIW